MVDNTYHKGIFGMLVRYFPMFDFNNNDANIVKIMDIDFSNNTKSLNKSNNKILKLAKKHNSCIVMNGSSRFKLSFIKNKIISYTISSKIISIKRINHKIIEDFIINAGSINKKLIPYPYNTIKTNKIFVFGIDEYFLNTNLVNYLLETKTPFTVKYYYSIILPFYLYIINSCMIVDKEKEIVNNIIDIVLQEKKELSFEEKYKILDAMIYNLQSSNNITNTLKNIHSRLIKVYSYIHSNKLFFGYFYKDFIDFVLKNKNIIVKESIITHFTDNEEILLKNIVIK